MAYITPGGDCGEGGGEVILTHGVDGVNGGKVPRPLQSSTQHPECEWVESSASSAGIILGIGLGLGRRSILK